MTRRGPRLDVERHDAPGRTHNNTRAMTAGVLRGVTMPPLGLVTDGSGFRRDPESNLLDDLEASAALLRAHRGTTVRAMCAPAGDAPELIASLRELAPEVCGVFLAHVDAERARGAQDAMATTLPVVADLQTIAIAATAALVTTLGRADLSPSRARLVIVGARRNPMVAELAVAIGIGEINSWGVADAQDFPLRSLTRRADVVVDLLGVDAQRRTRRAMSSPPVITLDEPTTPLLALPGLLTVAAHGPVSLEQCLTAALALVDHTPADRLLPRLSDPALAQTVVTLTSHHSHLRPVR